MNARRVLSCDVCGRPAAYYLESPVGRNRRSLKNFCLTHLKRFVGFVL